MEHYAIEPRKSCQIWILGDSFPLQLVLRIFLTSPWFLLAWVTATNWTDTWKDPFEKRFQIFTKEGFEHNWRGIRRIVLFGTSSFKWNQSVGSLHRSFVSASCAILILVWDVAFTSAAMMQMRCTRWDGDSRYSDGWLMSGHWHCSRRSFQMFGEVLFANHLFILSSSIISRI